MCVCDSYFSFFRRVELKVFKFQLDDEFVELQILDAAGKRFFRDILDGWVFFFFFFVCSSFWAWSMECL